MVHVTIDYSEKAPEAKAFQAVEDVKDWLGVKYDDIASMMKNVRNPYQFNFFCALAGFEGYPVEAWYEHFNGGGSWKTAREEFKKRKQHLLD